MLDDDRTWGNAITVADVPYPQAHQIAGPQFAVQPKIKKRKFFCAVIKSKLYPDGPMSLSFSGAFCPTIFPLFHGSLEGVTDAVSIVIPCN